MLRIGITGGIGCGKSTALGFLQRSGFAAVDTDQLARDAVAAGSQALHEVIEAFGSSILLSDGSLDRPGLARRVFSNSGERRVLEDILHPRICRAWQNQLDQWSLEGRGSGCVIIPLLFEKGYQDGFDLVIAIGCSETTQELRLTARQWGEEELRSRISSQWSIARKMELAHRVVWTEGTLETHFNQWRRLMASKNWGR